ncbi:response regulator [Herpetosiphon geysericola]|uniref:Chemotaxis protein CheY n=1 Tax=Herpetosiphon geysericola TaxID=70996 RepID=A0A0P6Y6V2_9CHLR|nr:response regulator transcription factor [Herpetosiphon geysericola]KPL85395.1 chemotaxis protein CheY [Herpetosiphon geysericola]
MANILVVDDEPNIREVVGLYLRREGHSVIEASDGEEALRLARQQPPDLVVLDLMLPKVTGLEVCRRLQSDQRTPVIMLTAKSEENDRIIGLGVGADDYVVKPFSPRELVARVEAVLRRVQPQPDAPPPDERPIELGALRVDPRTRDVQVASKSISLTAREFDLLYFLARHRERVFTRDQLMELVWGYTFSADTSTVTVHIRRLREKIEDDPTAPRYLQTVWGVGYKLSAGEQ